MCPYKRHRGKIGKRGENHVKTGRGWTDAPEASACLASEAGRGKEGFLY